MLRIRLNSTNLLKELNLTLGNTNLAKEFSEVGLERIYVHSKKILTGNKKNKYYKQSEKHIELLIKKYQSLKNHPQHRIKLIACL